jgi:hypothetical protein
MLTKEKKSVKKPYQKLDAVHFILFLNFTKFQVETERYWRNIFYCSKIDENLPFSFRSLFTVLSMTFRSKFYTISWIEL